MQAAEDEIFDRKKRGKEEVKGAVSLAVPLGAGAGIWPGNHRSMADAWRSRTARKDAASRDRPGGGAHIP